MQQLRHMNFIQTAPSVVQTGKLPQTDFTLYVMYMSFLFIYILYNIKHVLTTKHKCYNLDQYIYFVLSLEMQKNLILWGFRWPNNNNKSIQAVKKIK